MRKQTILGKRRDARHEECGRKRKQALELLSNGTLVSHVSQVTGVPQTTVRRIRNAYRDNDKTLLHKLLSPKTNRAGRPSILSYHENQLIKCRLRYAASRGLAIDAATLKTAMLQIALAGRQGFRTNSGIRQITAFVNGALITGTLRIEKQKTNVLQKYMLNVTTMFLLLKCH